MTDVLAEFAELEQLLNEQLDEEHHGVMVSQLTRAESWLWRVSKAYREQEQILAQQRNKFWDTAEISIGGKTIKQTVDDRKIKMEALTSTQQMTVDKLKDLAECIEGRISLGQSILKNYNTEIKGGIR